MAISISIRDETTSGEILHESVLDLLTARVTVHEMIRERILQEVSAFNRLLAEHPFRGLVQPTAAETLLNAAPIGKDNRAVDWREQFEVACAAFERNGFVVLVDDRQVENLDDEIAVRAETTVSFLKLVPLAGG
jgi:hypothetical protein